MSYMRRLLAGFCAGVGAFGLPWPGTPDLPGTVLAAALATGALLFAARSWAMRRHPAAWWLLLGVLTGLAWGGCAHQRALGARLPVDAATGGLALTVRIDGVPQIVGVTPDGPALRFPARILAGVDGAGRDLTDRRVRLSWYGAPQLTSGDVWRLQAVVRGPWSYANPGGFDYERWLLGSNLQGTGWVRRGERLAAAAPASVARVRSAVAERIVAADLRHGAVVAALLLGHGAGIGDDLWELLRRTGTVHLLVISGLHVSLATALGVLLGRLLVRSCPPLLLWLDARRAGCLGGALAAVAYVTLAGGGLPALRALVMGVVVLLLLSASRRTSPGPLLLLACGALLLAQPLAVHLQGFWLSFGAVIILLLVLGRRRGQGWAGSLLAAQLALSIGMLPLVALLTGTLPWLGVPANLVAVPLVSLGVVPLCLLAGLSMPLSGWLTTLLLGLADWLLAAVIGWLGWLAAAPAGVAAAGALTLTAAQAAMLWLIAGVPRGYWAALGLCAMLPLVGPRPGIPPGHYRVTAFDVGQGTAVAIDTREHRLVYDAGPAFPSGFDTGSAVVVPSLAATGPMPIDALVLSHDDVDHTGGAASVMAAARPKWVLRGAAEVPRSSNCHGRQWRWDGVDFRLLDVTRPAGATDNDRSCILLVDNGAQRVLLAGDIGAAVEARLLRRVAGAAPLSLMFAPHHGSASSSSRALVRVLKPQIVFVSAARGNRFGHPRPEVVARYRNVGARLFRTGWDGALVWSSAAPRRVLRWRAEKLPYWRGR
jgi:competence protein ComEC